MKTAVIKTGGKQYVVSEGDVISIEKLSDKEYQAGDKVDFNEVLLSDDGSEVTLGAPAIAKATVSGEVLEAGKGKKIDVLKYKAKSRYRVRYGHRQPFLKVKINKV